MQYRVFPFDTILLDTAPHRRGYLRSSGYSPQPQPQPQPAPSPPLTLATWLQLHLHESNFRMRPFGTTADFLILILHRELATMMPRL